MDQTNIRSNRLELSTDEIKPSDSLEKPVYNRQALWGWWDQPRLSQSVIFGIGAGGLGSNTYPGLLRAGIGNIYICDSDNITLSNLNRQRYYSEDLYKNKSFSLARNIKTEAVCGSKIIAYALDFEDVINEYPNSFDNINLALVLVDNESTRFKASKFFYELGKPAIFAGVSKDGNSGYVFFQKYDGKPCYRCINKPDINEDKLECVVPSAIYIHQIVSGYIIYLTILSLMNQKLNWYWRDIYLTESSEVLIPSPDENCKVCGKGV